MTYLLCNNRDTHSTATGRWYTEKRAVERMVHTVTVSRRTPAGSGCSLFTASDRPRTKNKKTIVPVSALGYYAIFQHPWFPRSLSRAVKWPAIHLQDTFTDHNDEIKIRSWFSSPLLAPDCPHHNLCSAQEVGLFSISSQPFSDVQFWELRAKWSFGFPLAPRINLTSIHYCLIIYLLICWHIYVAPIHEQRALCATHSHSQH